MIAFWILVLALGIIAVIALQGSFNITAIPYFATPYRPTDFGLAGEEARFKTEDGLTLSGWFIPTPAASDRTILIQHGLGSNAGDMLSNTVCLARDGRWNLFYYNFRGHGGSEGRVTSLGLFEMRDLSAAIQFLKSRKPDASRHLAVYGHSLGASVAIAGAARHPELEAVVAESPFASVAGTIRHFAWVYHGLPYFFVWLAQGITRLRLGVWITDFVPLNEIGRIAPRPIFMIQGERDLRMPMADFEALWRAAREPKERWIVPGADHGDPWLILPQEYEKRLTGFFRKVF